MVSERDCIKLIQRFVPQQPGGYLVKGIGDDCAVLGKDGTSHLLLTTDTLVEGVHFNLDWHPPQLLGRKSAAVNLSDIAAMGGRPRACLLSVAFPTGAPAWFEEFMAGFSGILQEHDTLLVGGDTVKGLHDISISVVVLGEADKEKICYRSGARPGDAVWVSGPLGNAAAGLALCRKGLHRAAETAKWRDLVKAHLDPEPLVELGQVLAGSGLVGAMMDVSDGLATDLAHICTAGGVGAEVEQKLLPVSEALRQAASELGVASDDWVLKGGEDYQLLFTAGPSDDQQLRELVSDRTGREIFRIGHIMEGQGVYLLDRDQRREISYQGYDHFPG